jgi:hypothetical protein
MRHLTCGEGDAPRSVRPGDALADLPALAVTVQNILESLPKAGVAQRPANPADQSPIEGERASGLIITAVETTPVRVPLATVFRGSHYQMTHRSTLVTRVHTADGIVGEAYVGDEDASLLDIERIVRTEIAPALTGLDAMATERCWQAGYSATYDILRDRRLGLVALACVDTAIWDAVGKALGQPLWRL